MILLAAILLALYVLPEGWALPVIAVAAVIEVAETFFWWWLSRRGKVQMGPETLVGATAVVVAACRPVGHVKLEGERWQARCEEGADAGERVRVTSLDGLTLVVERAA
jgi:membrane-bound serine protease (ClpP class)